SREGLGLSVVSDLFELVGPGRTGTPASVRRKSDCAWIHLQHSARPVACTVRRRSQGHLSLRSSLDSQYNAPVDGGTAGEAGTIVASRLRGRRANSGGNDFAFPKGPVAEQLPPRCDRAQGQNDGSD